MKISVKKSWEYEYRILEVETTEGGCIQTELMPCYDNLPSAILAMESLKEESNCDYYLIVNYEETKDEH